MNRNNFLYFIAAQVLIIFLQIQKASTFTGLTYAKQRNEKTFCNLTEERDSLCQKLEKLKSKSNVKNCALAQGFVPAKLEQVKRIDKLE